jgi:hypothetical protein
VGVPKYGKFSIKKKLIFFLQQIFIKPKSGRMDMDMENTFKVGFYYYKDSSKGAVIEITQRTESFIHATTYRDYNQANYLCFIEDIGSNEYVDIGNSKYHKYIYAGDLIQLNLDEIKEFLTKAIAVEKEKFSLFLKDSDNLRNELTSKRPRDGEPPTKRGRFI